MSSSAVGVDVAGCCHRIFFGLAANRGEYVMIQNGAHLVIAHSVLRHNKGIFIQNFRKLKKSQALFLKDIYCHSHFFSTCTP